MGELIVIFGFVLAVIFLKQRERYRNKLLEKGILPSEIKTETPRSETLRYGILFVGIAFGFVLGGFLEFGFWKDSTELAYVSSVSLCGGLALILSYLIEGKEKNENNKTQ